MHECFSTEDEFHYPEEDDDEDDDEDYGEDENVSRAMRRVTVEDETYDQPGYMQQDSCQEEYVEDAVEEISLEPPQLFQMSKMQARLFLQARIFFQKLIIQD